MKENDRVRYLALGPLLTENFRPEEVMSGRLGEIQR